MLACSSEARLNAVKHCLRRLGQSLPESRHCLTLAATMMMEEALKVLAAEQLEGRYVHIDARLVQRFPFLQPHEGGCLVTFDINEDLPRGTIVPSVLTILNAKRLGGSLAKRQA